MGTRNIHTYSRPLRYSNQLVNASDGSLTTAFVSREKGIDIRLALDVVRGALDHQYDVAVIFSQDQGLSEMADEIRKIARRDDRWIKVACAFPCSPTSRNRRGLSVSKVFPAGTILIKPWPVKLPSVTEQENITYAIGLVGRKLEIHESKKSALQDLFKTTLNKLMTGEIRVDDLDIDVSEVEA